MKYGKKNQVNLNPLNYNICVLGEAKIGKTTLMHQVCEKLVGEDGYLFCEMGAEQHLPLRVTIREKCSHLY